MNELLNGEMPLLKEVFNCISDLVFVMEVLPDETFAYAYVNEAAKKRLGMKDDIIGKTMEEILVPERVNLLNKNYRLVVETKKEHTFEDNDADLTYEETSLSPILDDSGKVTHIIAVIRDFSERKKLEKQLKLNEQKYKSIVENNTDAVFMLDETGTFLSVNKSGAEVSGYKEEELLHKGFHQLVYEPELPLVVHHFLKALEGETQEYTMHFYHKNGNMIYSAVKNIPIVVDGKVMGIYGIARDITMEHLKYETLKSQEAYYRMLVDRSPDPTIIYQDGVFHYVNYAFARLMKAANRDVLVGKQLEDFIPTTQQEIFYQKSKEVLQDSADSVSMEGVIFTMEGTRREVEVFSTKTTFNHEPAIYAVLRDITEKKEIERKISKMAYFDFLTELPNRQLFKESLEEMMEGAEEKGKTFALLFLDGDNFKRINDMFGHTGGDEFLKEFAKRLKKSLRKEDLVARVGGDEFNILLPQVKTRDEIVPIIERLYEGMRKPWEYAGKRVTMTMSIGVAIFPEDGKSIKTLIHNADEALYSVKEQGGNHYMFVGEM